MKPHPLSEVFPLMAKDELESLAKDIQIHGLNDQIVVLDGMILDGRNRFEACRIAEVEPMFRDYDGDDPEAFVQSQNYHRRHLSESQRAMAAARAADFKLGANQHTMQGRPTGLSSMENTDSPGKTIAAAAIAHDVGERTVRKARTILEYGSEEQIDAVNKGREAVSKVEMEIQHKRNDIIDAAEEDPRRFGELAVGLESGVNLDRLHKELKRRRAIGTVKADELKVQLGNMVPDHLRDLYGDPWDRKIADNIRQILDAMKQMIGQIKRKGVAYKYMIVSEASKEAANAKLSLEGMQSLLLSGLPYAVCPCCKGNACTECRMSGCVPEYRFNELKAEGKS